jgi:hypothetical protein
MKPDNQALQVFYGTVPLILILIGVWLRESLMLKDILARLTNMDTRLTSIDASLGKVRERLDTLETRAGVVYRD